MEETSKNNETAQLGIGAVICRLSSVYLTEPLEFTGDPIYYKMNGMYGYLMPSGNKVLWFYSDADGELFYDELEGWSVLNGIQRFTNKYSTIMEEIFKIRDEVSNGEIDTDEAFWQVLDLLVVSGMFSSEKLEQAYKDGVRDALVKGYGTFDEKNYR